MNLSFLGQPICYDQRCHAGVNYKVRKRHKKPLIVAIDWAEFRFLLTLLVGAVMKEWVYCCCGKAT
jgi:hypothetical protein